MSITDFRQQFPEFSGVADDDVSAALSIARELYQLTALGTLYLAAHLIALETAEVGGTMAPLDGGSGVVTQETIGPKRLSLRPPIERPSEAFFARTAYGRTFLALMRRATSFSVFAA